MANKPNEIRHPQVSCEIENYCLQRGQSLSYTADLNSEKVQQLDDPDLVEVVDSDPTVSISMDMNEFGSVILQSVLAGNYTGYSDTTSTSYEMRDNPVDILVSVKENSSDIVANRSAWFNNCYIDSISGTYQIDALATESYNFTGNSMSWFYTIDSDSSRLGSTKILNFDVVDGTGRVSIYYDDFDQIGELHAFTEDGLVVPTNKYSFDATSHSVIPLPDFSFVDGHRYRGLFWNRSIFPTPNDVFNPIGGITAKEIECFIWDEDNQNIDWTTDVGTATSQQALRVQSVDYEISFDREALKQVKTGMFGYALDTMSITATVSVLDSDLEYWAKVSGHWADYTAGDTSVMALTDFQATNNLSMKLDIFNNKEKLNHTADTLLKQIYFSGGKCTSIGESRDAPGRGVQTFDIRFTSSVFSGTGLIGRGTNLLWGGAEFAFVFISDDNKTHNMGWAEAAQDIGVVHSLAINTDTAGANFLIDQSETLALADAGFGFSNHGFDHGTGGMDAPPATPDPYYGNIWGYRADVFGFKDTSAPHYNFPDWNTSTVNGYTAQQWYLTNISKDAIATNFSAGSTCPGFTRNQVKTFAYPRHRFDSTVMWDLYKSGYKGSRCGGSGWYQVSNFPDPAVKNNVNEGFSVFRIPLGCITSQLVGGFDASYSEETIKTNVATYASDFKAGGDNAGGVFILFTHAYGKDRYHVTNYPNGWPVEDGADDIVAYEDGIRKYEYRYILQEIIKQGGRPMNFEQAIDRIYTYYHYEEDPATSFGQDYTDDIIFVPGTGAIYPAGEDYTDPVMSANDFSIVWGAAYVAAGVPNFTYVIQNGGVWDGGAFGDGTCVVFQIRCNGTVTDPKSLYLASRDPLPLGTATNDLYLETERKTYSRLDPHPKAGELDWTYYTEAPRWTGATVVVRVEDISNGAYAQYFGVDALYTGAAMKSHGQFYDRSVGQESEWAYHSVCVYGPGGIVHDPTV